MEQPADPQNVKRKFLTAEELKGRVQERQSKGETTLGAQVIFPDLSSFPLVTTVLFDLTPSIGSLVESFVHSIVPEPLITAVTNLNVIGEQINSWLSLLQPSAWYSWLNETPKLFTWLTETPKLTTWLHESSEFIAQKSIVGDMQWAKFFTEWLPPLPEILSPDGLFGDLVLISNLESPNDQCLEALERTAHRISWKPTEAKVRQALAQRTSEQGIDYLTAKKQILMEAILLVTADDSRSQYYWLGKEWITDDAGKKAKIIFCEHGLDLYWRWFCDRVCMAVRAILLEEPYPPSDSKEPATTPLEEADLVVSDDHLAALLEDESVRDILKHIERASPLKKQITLLIMLGHDTPEIASRLNVSQGNI